VLLRGVGARGAEDRAALVVNADDLLDGEFTYVRSIALHEPLVAILDAEDAVTAIDGLDRGGANYAVNTRRRPAADEHRQVAEGLLRHGSSRFVDVVPAVGGRLL